MEEIKPKVEQEVTKNMITTKVLFWISGLYNLWITLLIIPFLINEYTHNEVMFADAALMYALALPGCIITVPVSVISFNRLTNFKKIAWDTHRGIFVAFFIVTTTAALSVLSIFFTSVL